MPSKKKPFIACTLPRKEHFAVGACPYCGRLDTWLNNVPLTAYCGGSEEHPHKEWEKVVPRPFQPYDEFHDPKAKPKEIKYEDKRKVHDG